MPENNPDQNGLTPEELLEAWECLKEYAPLTREQAAEVIERLGGLKKMTLGIYHGAIREGALELAATILAHITTRCEDPNPEIAALNADILANMKHES